MTQSPARASVPTDALALLDEKGSAERALTAALASFQEQVQAVPSLDLAAVVEAARGSPDDCEQSLGLRLALASRYAQASGHKPGIPLP